MNSYSNLHMYVMAVPLLSAFALNLMGRLSRYWVLPLTVGPLLFSTIGSVLVLVRVASEGAFSYTVGNWKPPYGIELLVDPLSSMMLLLISVIALIATFSANAWARREFPGREHLFFTLYLIQVAGMMGLVLTADAFNLYVLLEITSITTYGLIAMGKGRAPLASFNYIILGSIGACFYLLGVGYLYMITGSLNMADIARIIGTVNHGPALATAFAFVLVGLCIKMAFFPLHGWLPNAYSFAPTSASMMIAPLMTKVTIYLIVRVILSVFTPEYVFYTHQAVQSGMVWAASAAIICASSLALGQRELRRMFSYIIVAEVGYMVGGIWLANGQGMTGAVLHIVNDALMTLCLFLAAAAMSSRIGSLSFDNLNGLCRKMPLTMSAFVLAGLSIIGIPPTCGFFSKWYLLMGGIETGHWEFVAALLFSSLASVALFFRIIEFGYLRDMEDKQAEILFKATPSNEAPMMMLAPLLVSAASLILVGLSSGPIVRFVRTGILKFL
ncbi:MAG TPA: proton-conducting transporter membrane subunit [Deltaproteobacteria bacterium]|nr:proton-conducting transporter membrane subunit [Deltaproteobacteria bacterium]HQB39116.1 proton-conducting transporter membrane subunit [Deltaproteobacteria bacterium]